MSSPLIGPEEVRVVRELEKRAGCSPVAQIRGACRRQDAHGIAVADTAKVPQSPARKMRRTTGGGIARPYDDQRVIVIGSI